MNEHANTATARNAANEESLDVLARKPLQERDLHLDPLRKARAADAPEEGAGEKRAHEAGADSTGSEVSRDPADTGHDCCG